MVSRRCSTVNRGPGLGSRPSLSKVVQTSSSARSNRDTTRVRRCRWKGSVIARTAAACTVAHVEYLVAGRLTGVADAAPGVRQAHAARVVAMSVTIGVSSSLGAFPEHDLRARPGRNQQNQAGDGDGQQKNKQEDVLREHDD